MLVCVPADMYIVYTCVCIYKRRHTVRGPFKSKAGHLADADHRLAASSRRDCCLFLA